MNRGRHHKKKRNQSINLGDDIRKIRFSNGVLILHNISTSDIRKIKTYAVDKTLSWLKNNVTAGPYHGGFTWACTPEGHTYWERTLKYQLKTTFLEY